MPKQTVEISIEKCPLCGNRHGYELVLGTTYLFGGGEQEKESMGMRELEILLECPVKKDQFKAEISVPVEHYLWVAEVQGKVKS